MEYAKKMMPQRESCGRAICGNQTYCSESYITGLINGDFEPGLYEYISAQASLADSTKTKRMQTMLFR